MKKLVFALSAAVLLDLSALAQESKVLTDWMDLHCKMVRATKGIPHVAYGRHFAYASVAAYESILPDHPGSRSLAGQLNGLAELPLPISKGNIHSPASVNAAYAEVLRHFYGSFGNCKAAIDSMEAVQKQRIDIANTNMIDNSIEFGRSVAAAIIKWAETDRSISKKTYLPLKGEGVWTPASVAAVPFWSESRSMTNKLFSLSGIKAPAYTAENNSAFYNMANEVYQVSINLTPEQKATALYWDDSPNGQYITVFGHWTSILSGILKSGNHSLLKAAEAYTKVTVSMYEASLLAWRDKYKYNVIRPITFIRQYLNKDWNPVISTPPHPEFPAAHATLSYAAATVLSSIFGDKTTMTDNSYTDLDMKERTYPSIRDAAIEAGMSRLYGGIHYRYSIEEGFKLGEQAANHVEKAIHFKK